jgi:hypothetical protein
MFGLYLHYLLTSGIRAIHKIEKKSNVSINLQVHHIVTVVILVDYIFLQVIVVISSLY